MAHRDTDAGEDDSPTEAEGLDLSASEQKALGAVQSEHKTASRTHTLNLLIASAFTGILLLAAIGLGVGGLVGGPNNGLGWAALVVFGVALLPGIGLFFVARKLGWRLVLFRNGFAFVRETAKVVKWEDVKSLYIGGFLVDKHLEFRLHDGTELKVDNSFKKFGAFSEAVRKGVSRAVVAEADAELKGGGEVKFGKVSLSKEGLEQEGKPSLAWAKVASITVEERVDGNVIYPALVIRAKAGKGESTDWTVRRISMFPNFDAFIELAGRFTRVDIG